MAAIQDDLIGTLLRDVSRSFYLTLRILPGAIRPQISLAYLLARASDTIADTTALPRARRVAALKEFRRGFSDLDRGRLNPEITEIAQMAAHVAEHQASPGEKRLLESLEKCFSALGSLTEADQGRIGDLLEIIVAGQIFDLERFPGETAQEVVALAADEELDRYTHMVAGCVGGFWTRMCATHLPGLDGWKVGKMEQLGVRFGKGLQLVNILRDLPADLRRGRCYLPVREPARLLSPGNFAAVQEQYDAWLDRALQHLAAGWEYTMRIPPRHWRVRLACVWPVWIGLKTIARLRRSNPLAPAGERKISRAELYRLLAMSAALCLSRRGLTRVYRALSKRAAAPRR
jgi:farnesyl-diphosphate farnesyltransferase